MVALADPLAPPRQALQSSGTERESHHSVTAKWYDVALFCSYGLLNNGLICVVYGAAQDITESFGYPNSAPSVTFVSTLSAIAGPLLLLTWPLRCAGYRTRAVVACLLGLIGLLLLAFSTQALAADGPEGKSPVGLVVGWAGVIFVALQQSIGENCACIRFRRFSTLALSCWGAGTGFAGIFPPLIYGAIAHWPLSSRFLAVVPILVINFVICLRVYDAGRTRDAARSFVEDGVSVPGNHEAVDGGLTSNERPAPIDGEPGIAYACYVIGIFSGVYGLEYFIFPTLVDRATKCPPTAALGDQAYNNSWVAYNIGVTFSRGSIAFFQFPCLWLVMVLQTVNVVFWVVEVNVHALVQMRTFGYVLQYVWMVFVGLMGGTAYANCIRTFHSSARIPANRRDQLINYAFAVSMLVILASTGLGELLDNTLITTEAVTRNCPHP